MLSIEKIQALAIKLVKSTIVKGPEDGKLKRNGKTIYSLDLSIHHCT